MSENEDLASLLAEGEAAVADDLRQIHEAVEQPTPFEKSLLSRATTMASEMISAEPVQREILCGRFPVRATSAIVSMGGVGKTTWATLQALTSEADFETLFISAEDGSEDYQSKIYNAIHSRDRFNQAYHEFAGETGGKIHVLDLKGAGKKLICEDGGSFVPALFVRGLVGFIQKYFPKVRLVIFETLSRFAGGEDNDRMEAFVTACDHIAIGINGAVAAIHHMGKAQGRDRVIDLYSGRGGSALGDNTRSFTVLTRLGGDYMGESPVVVDREDIEKGRVFEVNHVRNSYGPTLPPEYYATRPGACNGVVLERLREATEEDIAKAKLEAIEARSNKATTEIHNIIKAKGGWVKKSYFDTNTRDLIGLTQKQGRTLIADMLDAGSLAEKKQKSGSGQLQAGLVISAQNKGS